MPNIKGWPLRAIGLCVPSLLLIVASCGSHASKVDLEQDAERHAKVAKVPSAPTSCAFSASCPPGEYNLTSTGYILGSPSSGCSTTPPASCMTGGTLPLPSFTAPIITSVQNPSSQNVPVTPGIVMGAHAVYAIGTAAPASQVGSPDNRSAVFAWGDNTYGQLGDGTTISSTAYSAPVVPIYIPSQPVTQVAAGDTDACALLVGSGPQNGNTVYCWGQIMTSPGAVTYPTATQIASFPSYDPWMRKIAHGQHHACALGTNGNVFCWGNNNKGQLGLSPTSVLGVDPGAGPLVPVALPVPNASSPYPEEILDIAASGDSTCILATVTEPSATGSYQTGSNYVWCWGDNEQDSLGDGAGSPGNPQSAEPSPSQNLPLFAVYGGQRIAFNPPLVAASGGTPGKAGAFCVRTEPVTNQYDPWYCWGADTYGQLDLAPAAGSPFQTGGGDFNFGVTGPALPASGTVQSAAFFAVGANHGCVGTAAPAVAPIGGAGSLYCFGDNDNGQLGISASNEAQANIGVPWVPANEQDPSLAVTSSISGLTGFNEIAVGLNFSCAALTSAAASSSGNIACWGFEGQIVGGSAPKLLNWQAQPVPSSPCSGVIPDCLSGFGVVAVCPPSGGCCEYSCEPDMACSISSSSGACPPGEYANASSVTGSNPGCSFSPPGACTIGGPAVAPVATQIAAGANAVYAIGVPVGASNTAAVYAWGDNSYSQLGDGTTTSGTEYSAPTVPLFVAGDPVIQITAGETDACGLLQDGSVHCWGEIMTYPGEIIWPTQQQVSFPASTTAAAIAHGQHHACALSQSPLNQVYCWGNNDKGQLGIPGPGVDPTSTTLSGSLATGVQSPVPFPAAVNNDAITAIAAAGDSTCALFAAAAGTTPTNIVYCWGDDSQGSLGDGPAAAPGVWRSTPQPVNVSGLPTGATITALVGGSNGSAEDAGSFCAHVNAPTANPPVSAWYCWGGDHYGQIDSLPSAATYAGTNFVEGLSTPTAAADSFFKSATVIAIGGHHACAGVNGATPLTYCYGDDDDGQLGFTLSTGSATSAVNVNASAAVPVTTSTVLGLVPLTPRTIAGIPGFNQVGVGSTFTCGLYLPPAPLTWGNAPAWGNIACWGAFEGVMNTSAPTLLSWGVSAGACRSITGSSSSTVCGCNAATDCPSDQACNTQTHVCGAACGASNTTSCNGGCCSNGTCTAGTTAAACGSTGGSCSTCTSSCIPAAGGQPAFCGCEAPTDCPREQACNATTHQCGTACGAANETACNGGCCLSGTCSAGTSNFACGLTGGACVVCPDADLCKSGACQFSGCSCGGKYPHCVICQ